MKNRMEICESICALTCTCMSKCKYKLNSSSRILTFDKNSKKNII
jgi:hypothetical protein